MRKIELRYTIRICFYLRFCILIPLIFRLIFLPVTAITDSELDLILFRYVPIESDASRAALSERT